MYNFLTPSVDRNWALWKIFDKAKIHADLGDELRLETYQHSNGRFGVHVQVCGDRKPTIDKLWRCELARLDQSDNELSSLLNHEEDIYAYMPLPGTEDLVPSTDTEMAPYAWKELLHYMTTSGGVSHLLCMPADGA